MPQLFGFAPVSIRGPRPLPIIGKAKIFYELLDDPVAVLLRLRERGEVVALIDQSPAVVCVFGPEKNAGRRARITGDVHDLLEY